MQMTRATATWVQQADHISILFRVTAGRSYFRTRRNACVTAGKTTMIAGKIYHGCFEMLSWPYLTSADIINTCFWLLETWTKCSYFVEENIRPGAQRLAFEVKYEYIIRQRRIYRGPVFCGWASFQTTGVRCVNKLAMVLGQTTLSSGESKNSTIFWNRLLLLQSEYISRKVHIFYIAFYTLVKIYCHAKQC